MNNNQYNTVQSHAFQKSDKTESRGKAKGKKASGAEDKKNSGKYGMS